MSKTFLAGDTNACRAILPFAVPSLALLAKIDHHLRRASWYLHCQIPRIFGLAAEATDGRPADSLCFVIKE
jgi:hypothetical protein